MENLAKAILNVMRTVKNIEKSMTVGTGSSAYKGVPDKEVKLIIGKAMEENGLTILPIGVDAKTQISRWSEPEYNGVQKQKQSVFTEVTTKYLLLHESGESQVIEGYGHGVDTQDKGAGKATTYALKYALLYLFLVPTGSIDDTDNTHSDDLQVPQKKVYNNQNDLDNRAWLNKLDKSGNITPEWNNVVSALSSKQYTLSQVETKYKLSKQIKSELQNI